MLPLMRRNWLNDWDEARRHPWPARVFSLVGFGAIGAGFVLYMDARLPWPSWVVIIASFAALGVGMTETSMRQTAVERQDAGRKALKRLRVQAFLLVCGTVVLAVGAATNSFLALLGALAVAVYIYVALRRANRL
jgi:hypothetical protein